MPPKSNLLKVVSNVYTDSRLIVLLSRDSHEALEQMIASDAAGILAFVAAGDCTEPGMIFANQQLRKCP